MDRQIPATSSRLEEMFAHLKGALMDVVLQSLEQVNAAVSLTLDTADIEAEGDDEVRYTIEDAQARVRQVQEDLDVALDEVQASFFGATSFQECQERLPQLALFESRLQGGLLELEQALMTVVNPELYPARYYLPAPTIPEALEALAQGLEEIHQHLKDGDKEPLRRALESIERAQRGLTAALD